MPRLRWLVDQGRKDSPRPQGEITNVMRSFTNVTAINTKYSLKLNMQRKIYDANVLYESYLKAKKNSDWKPQVQRYEMNFLENIADLQEGLSKHTYKSDKGIEFIINERGHQRCITGNTMRDRVVRHAVCDEGLAPFVNPKLIYDNGASQKGKGVSFSKNRIETHLHKYFRKYGTNKGYILMMDFSKYYDNIRHDIAFDQLASINHDEDLLMILREIIDAFSVDVSYMSDKEFSAAMTGKFDVMKHREIVTDADRRGEKLLRKSVCIGDQTSQIIGIYYPHLIDNYVKIVEREKFYARYMDDSYIISNDKERLKYLLGKIKEIAAVLGIHVNDRKTHIKRIDKPFTFLQNTYYLTDSGKLVIKICKKRVVAMRRKLKKLKRKVDDGKTDCESVQNMFRSWMGGYKSILSERQRISLNALAVELYGENFIK